ncbi:transcription regulator spe-44-like [Mya arenaria]|uniref:transcription regulator spe-44-like n=1 Tax=Mya arenaria TaxID=6604 RepID=UPI0022E3A275|nr:transcription regulator spe-44-like [Mya arenaria]XP_052762932.1 transcription regulator spe-44-like [Mya arenaria]
MPSQMQQSLIKSEHVDLSGQMQMELMQSGNILPEQIQSPHMQTRGKRVNVFRILKAADMDLPPLDQTSESIPITCGALQAVLIRERFICPGINRECIEFAGQYITPKTFYVMADKGSLKDWKNAIRINGKKIRCYIDSGELDFYNHSDLCTGRCKSRIGQSKLSLYETIANSPTPIQKPNGVSMLQKQMLKKERMQEVAKDGYGDEKDVKPSQDQLQLFQLLHLRPGMNGGVPNAVTAVTQSGKPIGTPTNGTLAPIGEPMVAYNTKSIPLLSQPSHHTQISHQQSVPLTLENFNSSVENQDDDVTFWRTIIQLGLSDEFFREIKSHLDTLKGNMVKNWANSKDAKKASRIVNELGMRQKFDLKLLAHKHEFERQQKKLEREMEVLRKKVTECEQKSELLKRKSDCYETLMTKKLKLDEIPSDNESENSQSNITFESPHPTIKYETPSPVSTEMANNESRTNSPFPSQESSSTSFAMSSQDSSIESTLNTSSQDDVPVK